MLSVHRLTDMATENFWPVYEARVVAFANRYTPEISAVQRQRAITEMRQRFAITPQLAGYWLIMDGSTILDRRIVGHVHSWIADAYGRPYLLLGQVECEDEHRDEVKAAMREIFRQAKDWITGLNNTLAAQNAEQITYIDHWTIRGADNGRSAETWNRWLPELNQYRVMTVLRIALTPEVKVHPERQRHTRKRRAEIQPKVVLPESSMNNTH